MKPAPGVRPAYRWYRSLAKSGPIHPIVKKKDYPFHVRMRDSASTAPFYGALLY